MIFLSVSYDIYIFYVKLNFAVMTKILTKLLIKLVEIERK